MNKFVKTGLWVTNGIVVVTVAVVGYVAATFNPNDYKPLIVKLVQEKQQRTLKIDGDIKLAFFPKLGADLGKVSLSERNSAQEFAAIDSAKVYLSLLPLLRKELVIDRISIDGARVHWVRRPDGSTNIDDLLKKDEKEEESQQFKFDIDSVAVTRSTLVADDEKAGRKLTLRPVEFTSGRLVSGVPTKIELNLGVQSDKPRADFKVHLASGMLLELDARHYRLEGLKLTVKGQLGADPLDLKLDAPDIDLTPDKALHISQLRLELDSKQGKNAIKGQLSASLNGNMESQVFNLPSLTLDLTAGNSGFPGGKLAASLKGGAAVDLEKESARLNLNGRIDESSIQARLELSHFAPSAYNFDIAIDKLDVDRYLPAKAKQKREAAGAEKPFDLSALKELNAGGGVRIGALKASNLKVSNLRVGIKANEGRLQVNPLSANLYQGTLNGTLSVDARGTVPQVTAQQKLAGISIGPLMKDLLDKEVLDGRGSISLDLTTAGNTTGAMKKALNGDATINLRDGAIRGINLGEVLRNAKAKLGTLRGQHTVAASVGEKTDFTELSGTFKLRNGVAHNDDLSAKSPLLRLAGYGDIDIGNSSMNYLARAAVVGTLEGQGGKELSSLKGVTVPVRISGPFDRLSYTLDFNAMVGEAAKQKVEEKKEQIKSKASEELQKGLKGLFK
jgi:AsmA protein